MLLKNVASQGIFLYEYVVATGLPATGDSANITGYWSLDGGSATVFGTTNPTELSSTHMPGVYWQPLAQGETNGNAIAYAWKSSTSGNAINPVVVLTTGASLPTAAAGAAGGLFIAGTNAATVITTSLTTHFVGTVDTVTNYTGNTPQTGDSFARLGAPAGASVSADIAAIKSDTGTILTDVNNGAGAIYSRLGAPAGASMSADIAAVKTSVGTPAQASSLPAHFSSMVISVGGLVSIDQTPVLVSPRDLQHVADGSIAISDALWAAIGAGAGQKDNSSGTGYIISTPSTGTVLRTYVVTSISPPSTVPDKIV